MSEHTLDLTNVINVTVLGAPSNLGVPNINTAALFSKEVPLEAFGDGAFKIYTNSADVITDWGSGADASKIAIAFFAQQPNPLQTNGYLVIIPRLQSPSLESIEDAIVRTLNSVYYFGVLCDELIDGTTFGTLTSYIQSIDKMFFYATSDSTECEPGGMLDLLRSAGKTHSRGLYYHTDTAIDTQEMAAAYCARALSTDFSGSNTTQTMHLKVLATIVPDATVDQTLLETCQTAGVDVYVSIAGVPSLFTSGANAFFDEVYNEFWFKFALQTAGFNYLRSTSTKVPQTESGIEGLKNVYRKVCDQARSNGFVGPGSWTSSVVFGNPTTLIQSVADIGYYVYSQPIAQQSDADRDDRKAPLVQIAIKAQGAVHSSNVLVNVNL